MLLAPDSLVRNIPDPPARASSWVTRSFTAGLCVAASGLAAYWVLQRSTEPARLAATEEPTPFRLPPLTDQHPRPLDLTASRGEALPPLSAITRNDVLKVTGMDPFADAGVGEPPERPALGVRAARADAGPPLPPPPIIEPPVEPPTEPQPPEAPPPEGQALEARALESQPPEAQPPEAQPPEPAAAGEVCGFTTCEVGFGCCNASCGVCVAPGDNCDPTQCESKLGEGESKLETPASATCGRATCSEGQVCCNPSCGTCAKPGESCDSTPCDSPIQYPFSAICGRSTCSVGQECCNPSCGICVAPGDSCRQELCP
jgi:hypothetical protein